MSPNRRSRSPARPLRADRRALARDNAKLARDRDHLARIEPGGSPSRPLELASASLVELRARSTPCPICDAEVRVVDHTAETVDKTPLRLAHTLCPSCGHERILYFKLTSPLPN